MTKWHRAEHLHNNNNNNGIIKHNIHNKNKHGEIIVKRGVAKENS